MIDAVTTNRISALQQTLRTQGVRGALVVKPGQLAGIRNVSPLVGEKSSDFTRNLHRNLTDFIGQRFGITVTDILGDHEGRLEMISAANPTFMERVRNSNGNLEVLGHTVVFEMESDDSGRVYFLKNDENIRALSAVELVIKEEANGIQQRSLRAEEILRKAWEITDPPPVEAARPPQAKSIKLDMFIYFGPNLGISCEIVDQSGETTPDRLKEEINNLGFEVVSVRRDYSKSTVQLRVSGARIRVITFRPRKAIAKTLTLLPEEEKLFAFIMSGTILTGTEYKPDGSLYIEYQDRSFRFINIFIKIGPRNI